MLITVLMMGCAIVLVTTGDKDLDVKTEKVKSDVTHRSDSLNR